MSKRPGPGLRRRILLGLLGYVVVLSVAVIVHGFIVNEHAEQLVWQTLLDSELDHFARTQRKDPQLPLGRHLQHRPLRRPRPATLPAPTARRCQPGVHDDIMVDGVERVVLVREVDGRPLMLALDITELEQREFDMALTVVGSAVTLIVLLGIAIAWSVNRLVRPLSNMAQQIGRLQPRPVRAAHRRARLGQRRTGGDRRCAQRLPAAQRTLRRTRTRVHRQRQPRTAHADRGDRRRQRDGAAAAELPRRQRAAS